MLTLYIKNYINKFLNRLKTFSVKGLTSKDPGWFTIFSVTAIYDTINCKDDMNMQTAVSNQPIWFPPHTALRAVF